MMAGFAGLRLVLWFEGMRREIFEVVGTVAPGLSPVRGETAFVELIPKPAAYTTEEREVENEKEIGSLDGKGYREDLDVTIAKRILKCGHRHRQREFGFAANLLRRKANRELE
jgi:hypothetical protein